MTLVYDVLIVGAGPAGSALAICLAEAGLDVCMVDRGEAGQPRPGECLSPEAVPSLAALGHADLLEDISAARRCCGVQSIWMTPQRDFRDYFAERSSHGYFLDRQVFDARLRDKAQAAGVVMEQGVQVTHAEFAAVTTLTGLRGAQPWSGKARFVVDASGKSSGIARLGGAGRRRLSRQVAVAACLPAGTSEQASTDWLLIEADALGWWSGATSASGQRHLVRFFPEGGDVGRSPAELALQLQQTKLMHLYATADELSVASVQVLDAGCSALDCVATSQWLAVGEAAIAFDPVTSQGLAHAFGASQPAANAILEYLHHGRTDKLERYDQQTRITLAHSLKGLMNHYAQCHSLASVG
ncbi:NAD(P)/FAD-dependent oxidoreductase [Pseudomonas cichorii]|nr:NAD(P)/FAD-dependent oxidoreductase [Pseudomonas cichorii]